MTSQEKAINLGYLFLTYKPEKIIMKTHQYMHLFILHILVFFNFFIKVFLTPIHVPYQRAPIMGFVDVQQGNCPIWGWNNSSTCRSSIRIYQSSTPATIYLPQTRAYRSSQFLKIYGPPRAQGGARSDKPLLHHNLLLYGIQTMGGPERDRGCGDCCRITLAVFD